MEGLKKIVRKYHSLSIINRIWLLGIILAVVGLEGRNLVRSMSNKTVRVISAKRNLIEGSVLTIDDLSVTHVSESEQIPFFSDQEVQDLVGAEVIKPCKENEPISEEQIRQRAPKGLSEKIPRGLRAYPIELSHSLPLQPGDHVDVLFNLNEGATGWAIEDRQVLALKQRKTEQQIVLAVTLDEARKLDSVKEPDQLTMVLRNPLDVSVSRKGRKSKKRKQMSVVEILQDG